MTVYKKTWRVVSEDYDSESEAYKAYETINSTSVSGVYIEETTTPIVEWTGIDYGYGVVGYGWECSSCEHWHAFVLAYNGDTYSCDKCGKEHYSDWEEV